MHGNISVDAAQVTEHSDASECGGAKSPRTEVFQ